MSTPMTHSNAVFLTFFSPFLLQPHVVWLLPTALLNEVYPLTVEPHGTKKEKNTCPVLLASDCSHCYQQFYRDSELVAVGAEPPPQRPSFAAHSCGVKWGAQFCSSDQNASVELQRRRGGVKSLWGPGRGFSDQILLKNKHTDKQSHPKTKQRMIPKTCTLFPLQLIQPGAPAQHEYKSMQYSCKT